MAKQKSTVVNTGVNIGLLVVCLLLFLLICLLMNYCVENYENFGNAFALFKVPKLNSVANLQKLTTPIYHKNVRPTQPDTQQSTQIPKLNKVNL